MKNNTFMTRQQYRKIKNHQRSKRPVFFKQRSQPKSDVTPTSDFSFKEFKIKRLSKRLDKIIAVVIVLIVVVYLILIFVNF